MRGRTIRTPATRARVLEALAAGLSIRSACESARIGYVSYFDWRNADPVFRAETESAVAQGTNLLEDVALRRAVDGSDLLLTFLLRARNPELYNPLLVLRRALLQLELDKARAEAVMTSPTIDGQAEQQAAVIYPVEARVRDQFELPQLLAGVQSIDAGDLPDDDTDPDGDPTPGEEEQHETRGADRSAR